MLQTSAKNSLDLNEAMEETLIIQLVKFIFCISEVNSHHGIYFETSEKGI